MDLFTPQKVADTLLNTKRLLALDVATNTGFCCSAGSGTWDLRPKRDESAGMRLIRFKAKLNEVVKADDIKLIVFERSAGFHQNAVIVQSELHGVLKLFCEENGIEYKAYSASEIKRFATGKGNAKKDAMIDAAKSKYGINVIDDNHADALHIYHFAIQDLKL